MQTAFGNNQTKFLHKFDCTYDHKYRNFRSDINRELRTRFRGNGRNRYGAGGNPLGRMTGHKGSQRPVLLEKFIKISLYEGSLMVRHPLAIKARGSYFDEKHNVDREKNKDVTYYRQAFRDKHWANNFSEVLNQDELDAIKDGKESSNKPYSESMTELEESLDPSSLINSKVQNNDNLDGSKIGFSENPRLKKLEDATLQTLLSELNKSRHSDTTNKGPLQNEKINFNSSAADIDSSTPEENIESVDSGQLLTDSKATLRQDEKEKNDPTTTAMDDEIIDEEEIMDDEDEFTDDEDDDDDDDMFYDYEDDYDPYYRTLEDIQGVKVPMHVLLYGRNYHQVDSYSVDHNRKTQTHLYVSSIGDVPSHEEGDSDYVQDSKKTSQHRIGTISIWQPRDIYHNGELADRDDMNHSWCEENNYRHGFTLYSSRSVFNRIVKEGDDSLKTVFLLPTVMSKIDLQSEGAGSVELDGGLLEDLELVKLIAETGNVVAKDISCELVKLSSEGGDICCHGLVEGEISAETKNDGDFIGKNIGGPLVEITTQDGDITVWGDVKADRSKFHTKKGNVLINGSLSGSSEFLQAGKGNVTIRNVTDIGAVLAVVRFGDITTKFAETIDMNSTLEVETGNINITIPFKHKYRINAVAQRVNVSPRILNKGEIFESQRDDNWGKREQPMEMFTTSSCTRSEVDGILQEASILKNALKKDKERPLTGTDENGIATLTLIVHIGSITINVSQSKEEIDVEKGYDSVM